MSKSPIPILVVEDDSAIAAHLVRGLKRLGYAVELQCAGGGVRDAVLTSQPACVVLDLMMPEMDGFEVLQSLREVSNVPVIVLTAKRALDDRLQSFRLGATDFMTKPYFIEELDVRIRARVAVREELSVEFANVRIDPSARIVLVDQQRCEMTRNELEILLYLVERPGRVVQRSTLASATVSPGEDRSPRVVDVHMSRIRGKLGSNAAAHLATVRGLGYRFDLEVTP